MAHPFQTTRQRKAGFFVLAWTYVAATIVYRVTNTTSGVASVASFPGGFYRGTRSALEDFAVSTGTTQNAILAIYLVLGLVVLTLALYLLDIFAFEKQDYIRGLSTDGGFFSSIVVVYLSISIVVFTLLTSVAFLTGERRVVDTGAFEKVQFAVNWGIFHDVIWFVLSLTPQFLTLSIIGAVMAFLTVYVP